MALALRVEPGAAVGHPQQHPVLAHGGGGELDLAGGRGQLAGILQQIEQKLAEGDRIAVDR